MDSRPFGHDLVGFQDFVSVDERGLRTTGNIYGVGISREDKVQAVLKTAIIPAPLPQGWSHKEIAVTLPAYGGTAGYLNGEFIMTNYATEIDNLNDNFQYVYQEWVGDGSIVAQMHTTTPSNHSRAGVMMRETLEANSKQAMMAIAPAEKGAIFSFRKLTSGGTINTNFPGIPVPYWLKLTRLGDVFTGFISEDGVTWTEKGKVIVPMNQSIYVGLASASYNRSGMQTATFKQVSVTPN
jgi:hypothetical protein